MSFKPSKKTSKPLACDQATANPLRPRKSFFSFAKTSHKRAHSRPDGDHECNEKSNGGIHFPGSIGLPAQVGPGLNLDSPPQLQMPVRSIRSSILFSQQFDLDNLKSVDQPLHRAPSPAPALSNVPRPSRSTTRPTSWMMMMDGSYAPPSKAQHQPDSHPTLHTSGAEPFYHHSGTSNQFESSDEDSARGPSANGNPFENHEKPVNLSGVLAGYQVQPPPSKLGRSASPVTPPPPPVRSTPTSPPPAYRPLHSTPKTTLPPTASVNSTYSPLAAFLGHSKCAASPSVSQSATIPSPTSSSGPNPPCNLLSTFLGGQTRSQDENHESRSTEEPIHVLSVTASSEVSSIPQSATPPGQALSEVVPLQNCDQETLTPASNSQADVKESCPPSSGKRDISLDRSLEIQPALDSVSSSQPSSRPSSLVAKSDEGACTHIASIDARGTSTPAVPAAQRSKPQALAPSATPIPSHRLARLSSAPIKSIITSSSSSSLSSSSPSVTSASRIETNRDKIRDHSKLGTVAPKVVSSSVPSRCVSPDSPSARSIETSSSSNPTASALDERQQITRCRSLASDSGKEFHDTLDHGSSSFERRESRKRGVEKVYLDSSQDSSSCSEKYSSVDSLDADGTQKRATGSDLSAPLTDPSSTGSHPASPSKESLEVDHDQKEEEEKDQSERLEESGEEIKDAQVSESEAESTADDQGSIVGRPKIKLEDFLLSNYRIFQRIIHQLDYLDFFSLSQITKEFGEELERDERFRETILSRYLGAFGYRTLPSKVRHHGMRRTMEPMTIGLSDLMNFYAGLEFESLELIEFSKRAIDRKLGLDYRTARIIRSSTRAHNKLVAYVRLVEELDPVPSNVPRSTNYRYAGQWVEPVYRPGKAPVFKVWVPCVDHWMNNEELAECERELWRSQVWSHLRRGDVCWNVAIGDFGNEGKLLYDGRFLRDLLFEFDEVGHLPSWLNMLDFSPSYFHKVISSSTSAPIFYLDITSFRDEVKRSLKLSEDRVEVASPQARYRVKRWVYRAIIRIPQGHWAGYVVIEIEGTSEQAQELLKRCYPTIDDPGTQKLTPWRIMRERSRPGKLWIRPVHGSERIA